jgi:hypothetical protein
MAPLLPRRRRIASSAVATPFALLLGLPRCLDNQPRGTPAAPRLLAAAATPHWLVLPPGGIKSFISRTNSGVALRLTRGLGLLCIEDPISTFRTCIGGNGTQMLFSYKMNLDKVNVVRVILVLGSFSIVVHIALVCL